MSPNRLLPAALALLATPALAGPAEGQAAWSVGDYPRAVAEWRPAAIAGDPAAQYGLAQAYLYGRGVTTDLDQAELWFRKAADQGHIEAADNLGLLLFQQDKRREALPFLERSAARGEPRAQYVLGTAKFNGDLVDKDWVGGYALMTRASAAGLPQASRALAQMDREIPLAQRQQGQVLARDLEVSGMQVAAAPTVVVARPGSPTLPPVMSAPRTTPPAVPAAAPVVVATVPVQAATPVATPAPVFTPTLNPDAASMPTGTTAPGAPYAGSTVPIARPAAKPVVKAMPPRTTTPVVARMAATTGARAGDWLVQIGAFRSRASAQSRFDAVRKAVPSLADLQPFLEQAGAVTRTRAGPFGSQSEAEAACRAIRSTGQACFPTRR